MANSSKETPFAKHRGELKEKAGNLGQNVQELGKATKNLANDTVDYVKENAGEYYQQSREKAKKWEQGLEDKIKTNPIQSLLIALGIGWVIGLIMRRR